MAGTAVVAAPMPPPNTAWSNRIKLERPAGRIVLVFNATHLLFNAWGFAKSSDVVRLFDMFLSDAYSAANIDLIFVGAETGLPIEIRNRTPRLRSDPGIFLVGGEMPIREITTINLPAIGRSALDIQEDDAAIGRLHLRICHDEDEAAEPPLGFYFHRLQQPRISVVIMAAFPRVALVIASGCKSFPTESLETTKLTEAAKFDSVFQTPGEFGESTHISREKAASEIAKAALAALTMPTPADPVLIGEIDRAFGKLYKSFGRSRFCSSIVCAAVEDAIEIGDGPREALRIYQSFCNAVMGLAEQSREDAIVREVLDYYRKRASVSFSDKCELAQALEAYAERFAAELPAGSPKLDLKRLMGITGFWAHFQALQEELLALLSMIGVPTEADCLSRLKIETIDDIADGKMPELRGSVERTILITMALEVLARRSLVFRFIPRPSGAHGTACRYAVHRLVQRHGLRRMHQPRVEFPEVDNYMPTLYASQPNDLPYPTADAQRRLREMVVRLSLYPANTVWGPSGVVPELQPELASRMLRAAYGVLRSVYSLASVARFDAYVPSIKPPPHGFFEQHRHNIRWMLRRAQRLQGELERRYGEKKNYENLLPFYPGDVVWLYNECGALSLLQGSLHDAAKLLSEALRAVQLIEAPPIGGALTNTIKLNRALVDIEMGRLRKADETLQRIALTQNESRHVRWIAWGYRGLVAHIRGDVKGAESNYLAAIGALRAMKKHRAASIFSRHCADLYSSLGASRNADALAMADDAVKLASIGNHEDVYHMARLTRVKSQLKEQRKGPPQRADRAFSDARAELDSIERYARNMGMPRLLVDADRLDASFRLEIGDLYYAAKSVTRALALANENGLVLKTIALNLLLAEVSLRRSMPEDARLYADAARNLAIQCEYATAQDEAQSLLAKTQRR